MEQDVSVRSRKGRLTGFVHPTQGFAQQVHVVSHVGGLFRRDLGNGGIGGNLCADYADTAREQGEEAAAAHVRRLKREAAHA